MQPARLLIVDDDEGAAEFYRKTLSRDGANELVFQRTVGPALGLLKSEDFDVAIASLHPPGLDGIALLDALRETKNPLPVILVTANPTVDTATAGLRLGAADYLAKPLKPEDLAQSVDRVLAQRRIAAERELLRRQVERPYSFDDIIGTSPAMRRVYDTIERIADSNVDVLVIGETGTGKELVARAIHRRSPRSSKPFVPVDCGAIPENLLESEFFGHERGAFTGADTKSIGLLEFADGGTFFLDEVGELPMLLQAKLLRTLQERKIRRVGGRAEIDVDLRVVAATGRNLEAMIAQGRFRQDLYYRINVVRIDLPPLRERGDDLGLLAEYFATRYSREMNRELVGITPEAYQVLSHYHWPGNVRELQNIIRRALALTTDSMLGLDDLPDAIVANAGEVSTGGAKGFFPQRNQHMANWERHYLTDLLTKHHGDVKTAAEESQVPRGTLYRLMKNHGLDGARFR
ncbi:MAG TPA: sigma-54 dependent transcriptional regulator [Pirellulales bacterium]|nr:sigma-54 dependent transcriptional regulator [Pirellulales bacterium]